jgi:hypothetical protein
MGTGQVIRGYEKKFKDIGVKPMEKLTVGRKCPLLVQIRQFAAISCSVYLFTSMFLHVIHL